MLRREMGKCRRQSEREKKREEEGERREKGR